MSWINNTDTYQNFQNFQNPELTISEELGGEQNLQYTGRIMLKENEHAPSYELYSGSNKKQSTFHNSVSNIQEDSLLSCKFFDIQNVDKIQNQIISDVAKKGYSIGRQSDLQLQIIMRSIYLSNSKNIYSPEHLNQLNGLVVSEAVRLILPEIQQYLGYREDISKPRHIISHPVNPSIKGQKTFSLFTA